MKIPFLAGCIVIIPMGAIASLVTQNNKGIMASYIALFLVGTMVTLSKAERKYIATSVITGTLFEIIGLAGFLYTLNLLRPFESKSSFLLAIVIPLFITALRVPLQAKGKLISFKENQNP
jgi:hypothetical protein